MTIQTTEIGFPAVGRQIAISLFLTSFVAATYGFGIYLFAQLVPDMRAELGFDYSTVGMITALGQAGFLLFALAGGWLAPKIGGGRLVLFSAVLCSLCLLLLGISNNIIVVGALLVVMAGTAASVYVPMVELVTKVIPYDHRGKVLGLISSGTSYGVFLNSFLVPYFIGAQFWRGAWLAVGVVAALAAIGGGLTLWLSGLLDRDDTDTSSSVGVQADLRNGSFRQLWVWMVCGLTFLNGASTLPFQNYLSAFLREELNFSVEFAATVWGSIGLIGMVSGFAVGWVSDKIGTRSSLVACYICVALASIILITVPYGIFPVVSGVLFAIAFYPIFGLIPAYISKTSSGAFATSVFAVANITQGLGGVTGNYLAGAMKSYFGTFHVIYVAILCIAVLLGVMSILLPEERK